MFPISIDQFRKILRDFDLAPEYMNYEKFETFVSLNITKVNDEI